MLKNIGPKGSLFTIINDKEKQLSIFEGKPPAKQATTTYWS